MIIWLIGVGAVEHINDIPPLMKYILVDRGDLSTDIGIKKIHVSRSTSLTNPCTSM